MDEAAHKDLAPVGDFIDAVIAAIGGGAAAPMLQVRQAWPRLAGPEWVDRARPVSYEPGSVVVEVPNGAAASMFRYETSRIARGIAEVLGTSTPPSISVRVARRPAKG